jgi:hypothetical protein
MAEGKSEVSVIAEGTAQAGVPNDACESTAKVANSGDAPESLPEHHRGIRLTTERELFAAWLALTVAERLERGLALTQREFAAELNISECSLSRFKNEQEFQRDMSRRLRAICQEEAPAVIRSQAKKAVREEDTPAARLLLDHAMPKETADVAVGVQVINMPTAELVATADEDAPLPEWAKKQEQSPGIELRPEDREFLQE